MKTSKIVHDIGSCHVDDIKRYTFAEIATQTIIEVVYSFYYSFWKLMLSLYSQSKIFLEIYFDDPPVIRCNSDSDQQNVLFTNIIIPNIRCTINKTLPTRIFMWRYEHTTHATDFHSNIQNSRYKCTKIFNKNFNQSQARIVIRLMVFVMLRKMNPSINKQNVK